MRSNNRIVVDLNKCQYAKFGYRNQHGMWCAIAPGFTVNGVRFHLCDMVPYFSRIENAWLTASAFEVAIARGLVDIWTPELTLQLQANHSLIYIGEKAKSIWAEWCRRQFNKKNKADKPMRFK